jgi:bifunctional ADP-heptose synthase (sugar kinase/adenylyltransferase)
MQVGVHLSMQMVHILSCFKENHGSSNAILFSGSFDIVHVKDAKGHQFATRMGNVFIIGKGNKEWVSLPRGKGVRLTIAEERDRRLAEKVKH